MVTALVSVVADFERKYRMKNKRRNIIKASERRCAGGIVSKGKRVGEQKKKKGREGERTGGREDSRKRGREKERTGERENRRSERKREKDQSLKRNWLPNSDSKHE